MQFFVALGAILLPLVVVGPAGANSNGLEPTGNDLVLRPPSRPPLLQPKSKLEVIPTYPQKAIEKRIGGYVEIRFEIESDGSVNSYRIIKEFPEGYGFGDAALAVFPKWKFETSQIKSFPSLAVYRITFSAPKIE
jgi:TonB family protein